MAEVNIVLKTLKKTGSFPFYDDVLAANVERLKIGKRDVGRLHEVNAIHLSQSELRCVPFLEDIYLCFFVFMKTNEQPWTLDNYNKVRIVLKHCIDNLDSLLIPVSDLACASSGLPVSPAVVEENYKKQADQLFNLDVVFKTLVIGSLEEYVRDQPPFRLWKEKAVRACSALPLPCTPASNSFQISAPLVPPALQRKVHQCKERKTGSLSRRRLCYAPQHVKQRD